MTNSDNFSKKFKVVAQINGCLTRRCFNEKKHFVLAKNLSLQEANRELLDYFNYDNEEAFNSWNLAFIRYSDDVILHVDGTISYEHDGLFYVVVEEE